MRKLVLEVQMSIDGYIADKNGRTDWMLWNWGDEWPWDEELRKYHTDLTASADCVLLSRKMAEEGFIHHWTAVAEKKNSPQADFAKKAADMRKVVFTKTLKKSVWENTVLAKGDIKEEVNKLKTEKGKSLIAYGGADFASSLIKADLIDEYHLIINPVVLGSGLSIFDKINSPLNLSSVSSTHYSCGITVLRYDRVA